MVDGRNVDTIFKDLELQEMHNAVKPAEEREREKPQYYKNKQHQSTTAALLASQNKELSCTFCLKKHAHKECQEVKDPQTRKTLIRKYGRCFKCLAKGHRASNCSVVSKCKLCSAGHHTALCTGQINKDDKPINNDPKIVDESNRDVVNVSSPTTTLHVGTGGLVALQTARCIVRGEKGAKAWVLFDLGSHRSFVTLKAACLVNPKGLGRELQKINTFGQKCAHAEQREVVKLKLEPVNGGEVLLYIVPNISTIPNGHVELVRNKYPHLKGMWFSNVSWSEDELEADILIGADYLWNFQTDVTNRGRPGEPVTVETKLEWVFVRTS